ncbi:MAG: asparagine synthase (glutamine-hydrolyzing) [bacterium]|nr:asparagine synthase (glutamine-hydrolyzing) [bacterium]
MCAIIGYIGKPINKAIFEKARDAMAHRGPDDKGVYYDESCPCALGHRRLSILDLSQAGRQPMVSSDGRYVIVFNGEIFNYLELKKELSSYSFHSQSDTEVLLAAFITWGEACLQKFNGQFAFAIYDTRTQELFCARDHLGIKPFFYTTKDGAFAFASEIKGLLALGVEAKPNNRMIYDYLALSMYDHTQETFFEHIMSLPAGHFLRYAGGRIVIQSYWDLKNRDESISQSYKKGEAVERLQFLLQDALRLQFRSDVPVGLNLSSGIDSNALLYFSQHIYTHPLHLFTSCVADEGLNECALLEGRLLEDEKNRWHTDFLRHTDIAPLADEVLATQDQPYGGMPTIANYHMYRETQHQGGVKVILEGQGVDEILAGYSYYLPAYYRDAMRRRDFYVVWPYFKMMRQDGAGWWQALSSLSSLLFTREGRSQDLSKESGTNIVSQALRREYEGEKRGKYAEPFSSSLLNAQYRDLTSTKLPRVLRFNDHASMAFSKELRVPFLDRRIVEFCFFAPPLLKIKTKYHKVLLRKAVQPYIPDSMKRNPKVGFGAFQTKWFRAYFKEFVYSIITSHAFQNRPYFDHDALQKQTDAFFAGDAPNSFFLWQAINLDMWFRRFIEK